MKKIKENLLLRSLTPIVKSPTVAKLQKASSSKVIPHANLGVIFTSKPVVATL